LPGAIAKKEIREQIKQLEAVAGEAAPEAPACKTEKAQLRAAPFYRKGRKGGNAGTTGKFTVEKYWGRRGPRD
jgi:hypothetical protein